MRGNPPYGFRFNADRSGLVPYEPEHRILQDMVFMRNMGCSLPEIAKALNENGHRTRPQGGRNRGRGPFHKTAVSRILKHHRGLPDRHRLDKA